MTAQLTPEGTAATTPADTTEEAAAPYQTRHAVDTTSVPFRVADGVHLPFERYYNQEFAELENTKMWMHTWQWACREEQIPLPGDYIEYTIVDKTVMVVRQADNSIRVMHNVCPHRGRQLVEPATCGTFGADRIVCPFHGWQFNTDGSQRHIYARQGFASGSLEPDNIRLSEVRSTVKYGFVWINFDDDAPDLDEFLGSYDNHLAPMGMDRMRLRWWKHTVLPCNWKVALEAFLEAYHVMQTHPELALGATGEDFDPGKMLRYYSHGMGHMDTTSAFDPSDPSTLFIPAPVTGVGPGRYFIEQNRLLFDGTDGFATARDEFIADRVRDLPEDQLLPRYFEELYKYAEDADIPLPPLDPNASGFGFIFPNLTFLGVTGNLMFYRVRPNGHDPNSAIFEALAMQIPRRADMDLAAPDREGPLGPDEWPYVLRQDMGNLYHMQAGIRSGAIAEATLSPEYEPMIFSLHTEIDRYLATY